jgi:predicted MFS family arabinose efflux permease
MMRGWYLSLIPRKIASTLFSTLLPLYIVYTLGRSTVDIGMVTASIGLAHIPGSIIWGYLADRTRRCRFIVISTLTIQSILILLLTKASGILDILFLSIPIGFFGSALPPVEDILIAEGSSRYRWSDEARSYGFVSEIGDLSGIAIGALLLAFYEHRLLLHLCGLLILSSAIASLIFVEDPIFMVERKFVRLERCIEWAGRLTAILEYQDEYGEHISELTLLRAKIDTSRRAIYFGSGTLAFTMATDLIFTFISIYLCQKLLIPQSIVFVIVLLNEVGSIAGYLWFKEVFDTYGSYISLKLSAFIRAILVFTFIPCSYLPYVAASIFDTVILTMLGIFYTLFALSSRTIRMEIIPEGWVGLYACITKIGSIIGMAVGGLIIAQYGFNYLFMTAGILFIVSCILFHFS